MVTTVTLTRLGGGSAGGEAPATPMMTSTNPASRGVESNDTTRVYLRALSIEGETSGEAYPALPHRQGKPGGSLDRLIARSGGSPSIRSRSPISGWIPQGPPARLRAGPR